MILRSSPGSTTYFPVPRCSARIFIEKPLRMYEPRDFGHFSRQPRARNMRILCIHIVHSTESEHQGSQNSKASPKVSLLLGVTKFYASFIMSRGAYNTVPGDATKKKSRQERTLVVDPFHASVRSPPVSKENPSGGVLWLLMRTTHQARTAGASV